MGEAGKGKMASKTIAKMSVVTLKWDKKIFKLNLISGVIGGLFA